MFKVNISKRLVFSILISLLIIQLSLPAYAPPRRPDYIDYVPLSTIGDVSMNYENVVIRSITGSGFGGFYDDDTDFRNIIIDAIGYGSGTFTQSETGRTLTALFVQSIQLNIVVDTGSRETVLSGESFFVIGKSDITFLSSDFSNGIKFEGIFEGNLETAGDDGQLFMIDLQSVFRSTQGFQANYPLDKFVNDEFFRDITDGTSNTLYLKLDTNILLNRISDNITVMASYSSGQLLGLMDSNQQV